MLIGSGENSIVVMANVTKTVTLFQLCQFW